ncbi:hypothetical protein [Streptomyces decoyicus]|uniref:hypothetical protein n=1 Tax=Streptomyces decoyicus TaxID=249567 RepID=UPI00364962AE
MTGRQRVGIHQALAGRMLTVRANHRSVHFLLDGHLVTTVPSQLRSEDIAYLTMRYGPVPPVPSPNPPPCPGPAAAAAAAAAAAPRRRVLLPTPSQANSPT